MWREVDRLNEVRLEADEGESGRIKIYLKGLFHQTGWRLTPRLLLPHLVLHVKEILKEWKKRSVSHFLGFTASAVADRKKCEYRAENCFDLHEIQ